MSDRGDVEREGASIHWEAFGEGPPVLMIQGSSTAGCTWRPQVEGLADRYRVVWFDNRGTGGSTLPEGPLTIEQMALDGLAVMDAQGWTDAHVVGHSMGGLIAQALAIAAPTRVRSLSLMSTFARGQHAAFPGFAVLWMGAVMRMGTKAARRRAGLRMVFPDAYLADKDLEAFHEEVAAIFGRDVWDQPKVTMRQVRAMSRYDPSPHAATIAHLPALVLTGAHDRIAKPRFLAELAARFGVEPVILPDSGHACTIQDAAEVNRLLAERFETAG